ncbi:MAG: TIGR01777 family protein [Lentisphaeria bacterium]|nr:TIGR01777 family oxidoreductase [Lentisphaeria bacterium]NQZ68553.1 TIGR01777 family protein [Lentisphaeria bacterium]
MKKIAIAGGSGYMGKLLIHYLMGRGHQLIVLSRKDFENQKNLEFVKWDGRTHGAWHAALEDADVLINLCGQSVNCRYNEKNKQAIYQSRLKSTQLLGEALERLDCGPELWMNASSATIYRSSKVEMDEEAQHGEGFSVEVCEQWESRFYKYKKTGARQIALRMAMVFDTAAGGPYDHMKEAVQLGFGKGIGDGNQYVSWIHGHDLCRAIDFMLMHKELEGNINISSPQPIPNADFMKIIADSQKPLFRMRCPNWLLSLGVIVKQTEKELVLKSRRVVPKRLLDAGFHFHYADFVDAEKELSSRTKSATNSENVYCNIDRWER